MSDHSGESDEDANNLVTLYKCRKCNNNATFTRAELETHRAVHKSQKRGKNKMGPPSGSRKAESTSTFSSEITLFEEISTPPKASPKSRNKSKKKMAKSRSPPSSEVSESSNEDPSMNLLLLPSPPELEAAVASDKINRGGAHTKRSQKRFDHGVVAKKYDGG